jgi:hypothetical protein
MGKNFYQSNIPDDRWPVVSQFFNPSAGTSGGSTVAVTMVATPTYTVQPINYALITSVEEPVTIVLPPTPTKGNRYLFKDGTGTSGSNAITIEGNGNSIDDQTSYTIQNNWGFVSVLFNGAQWNVVNQ